MPTFRETKSAPPDDSDKKDATSRSMFAALIVNSDAVKIAIRPEAVARNAERSIVKEREVKDEPNPAKAADAR